jgi:hypothetical protein
MKQEEPNNQIVANGVWKKTSDVERVQKHIPKPHLVLHILLFIILSFVYHLSSKLFDHNFSKESAIIFAVAVFIIQGTIAYLFSRNYKVTKSSDKEVSNPDYDPNNLY